MSDEEQTRDAELGIDRRAFSNLWMEPMAIGELPLLQHSFLQNVEAQCVESWFQAAKCEEPAAAHFIFFELKNNPKAQANAGRGWLPLTKSHVEYFSKAGLLLQTVDVASEIDPEDKSWAGRSLGGTLENLKKFHQLSDGSYAVELAWADEKHVYVHCPKPRADWDEIKNELMFHLSVYKYLGPAPQCAAATSALALVRHGVRQVTKDTVNVTATVSATCRRGSNRFLVAARPRPVRS